jgi:hypothetical protein
VSDDTGDLGLANGTDFTVETLAQVEGAGPKLPSPTEVTNAVLPVLVSGEGGEALGGVAHKASDRVGIEGQEEGDEEVVGVPKRLEGLLPDAVVRRGVHQEHAQKHDMAGDATGLSVVNLNSGDGANLRLFDVVEAGGRSAPIRPDNLGG